MTLADSLADLRSLIGEIEAEIADGVTTRAAHMASELYHRADGFDVMVRYALAKSAFDAMGS